MRRWLTVLIPLTTVGLSLVLTAGPTHALDCPAAQEPAVIPNVGEICVVVTTDDTTDGDDGDGGDGGNGNGNPPACESAPQGCIEGMTWFPQHQCYGVPASPQPEAGNPLWGNHDPSEGTIFACWTDGPGQDPGFYFFVPNGAAPPVDGAAVARRAVDRMALATLTPHTAPAPPDKSVVFVENWLWTDRGPWDNPQTLTVGVGGTSVTVRASVHHAEWDMGDGNAMVCSSPGRAWVNGMSDAETTDCGYRYEKDGTFTISGRLFYEVSWTCSGRCVAGSGTLGDYYPGPAASTQLTVVQRQTVTVN